MLVTARRAFFVLILVALSGAWLTYSYSSSKALELGLRAYRNHDLERLEEHIATLSESSYASGAELKVLEAGAALLRKNPEDAVSLLSEVEPSETWNATLLQIKGDALYRLKRFREAEDSLSQLVSMLPDDIRAHRLLAVIYYDIGAMKQTIHHLKQIMRLAPADFRPHRMIGQIYLDFEKYTEASRAFRSVISLSGDLQTQAESRRLLAEAESKQGNYEAALASLQPVSHMSDTFGVQAECLWNLGRLDEARSLLSRALAGAKPATAAVLTFARISLEDGNPDAAITVLTEILAREPGCVDCRHQLAMAYRAKGDLLLCQEQLAENEKIKALKTQLTTLASTAIERPFDWEIRLEMATICEQLGMPEMSETWRRAAKAIQTPRRPDQKN